MSVRGKPTQNRRKNDSAMLQLMNNMFQQNQAMEKKIDDLFKLNSESQKACIKCKNDTDAEVKPLVEDYKERTRKKTLSENIVNFVKRPSFFIPVALAAMLFVANVTNTIATGQVAIKVDALKNDFVLIKAKQPTFRDLTNAIKQAKNWIQNND